MRSVFVHTEATLHGRRHHDGVAAIRREAARGEAARWYADACNMHTDL